MKRPRILVVDADLGACAALELALSERGYDVGEALGAEDALLGVPSFAPDALLARVEAPGDGTALLAGLRALGSDAVVVVLSSSGRLDAAVEAMRAGAESYLTMPVDGAQAAVVIEKALEKRRLRRDTALLREQVRQRHALVGSAPELVLLREVLRRAAPTKATMLVLGETGTGRELVAQAVHEASPRRDRPFVRVSCASVSQTLLESELFGHEKGAFAEASHRREGSFELADGGTLFLHEVAHLPPQVQVKLLRVLQQGELERVGGHETLRTDVRVVASSTLDLAEEVRAGRFRDDLYYRLNVVSVTLPPLRERKGDIPALVEHFMGQAARARAKAVRAVSPGALSALFAYDWPGNVRELEGVVDRAVALCQGDEISAEHLSPVLHGARPDERTGSALIPGATLFEIEREAILRTLEEAGGSTARAAEVLGISVRKIQYRLKEYKAGHPGRRRSGAGILALG